MGTQLAIAGGPAHRRSNLPAVEASDSFDFSGLRIFTSIPDHDDYDVTALRGMVVVFDRSVISREGILEGAFYVRESQHTESHFPYEEWLRRELAEGDPSRRAQPLSRLKTRREVVQAIHLDRRDSTENNWAVRLHSGFTDGPYYDWAFGLNFVGKAVGLFVPGGEA